MKLVIADPKTGNCFQRELDKAREPQLYGKKIGDAFDGGIAGLEGYKLEITGGSDKDGFPMRPEVHGVRRIQSLLSSGPGVRGLGKGQRKKKTVVGNTVGAHTMQLNTKIIEYGSKTLAELGFTPKPKEKKEEAK
ncbi:MAG: 30S ribosomal protein S6e [Candidatus Micrarchaeia archaeon]|jgi:small subunit ribosomal protein S6e